MQTTRSTRERQLVQEIAKKWFCVGLCIAWQSLCACVVWLRGVQVVNGYSSETAIASVPEQSPPTAAPEVEEGGQSHDDSTTMVEHGHVMDTEAQTSTDWWLHGRSTRQVRRRFPLPKRRPDFTRTFLFLCPLSFLFPGTSTPSWALEASSPSLPLLISFFLFIFRGLSLNLAEGELCKLPLWGLGKVSAAIDLGTILQGLKTF